MRFPGPSSAEDDVVIYRRQRSNHRPEVNESSSQGRVVLSFSALGDPEKRKVDLRCHWNSINYGLQIVSD